jgi:hypothetical protein
MEKKIQTKLENYYDVHLKIVSKETGKSYHHCYINHIQANSKKEAEMIAIDKMTGASNFDHYYPDRNKIIIQATSTLCKKIHLTGKQNPPKL